MVARFTPDYNEQNLIRYLCEASLTLSPLLKEGGFLDSLLVVLLPATCHLLGIDGWVAGKAEHLACELLLVISRTCSATGCRNGLSS